MVKAVAGNIIVIQHNLLRRESFVLKKSIFIDNTIYNKTVDFMALGSCCGMKC